MKCRLLLFTLIELALVLFLCEMPMRSFIYLLLVIINSTIVNAYIFLYGNRPYSLQKMVNIFILFFFILANAVQFSNNSMVTSIPIRFEKLDYILFQCIVFFIILFFNLVYIHKGNKSKDIQSKRAIISFPSIFLLAIGAALLTILYYRNDMSHLFLRGLLEDLETMNDDVGEGVMSSLIFDKIVRSIPFVCFIIAANEGFDKKRLVSLLIIMSVVLFPTGLSRNAVAMYWLPVLLFSTKLFERPNLFIILFFIGLLVVFPLMDNFRYWSGDFEFAISLDYLNTMNFDSSQEMMVVIKNGIITYGRQLLGVLLFFVPRSIWPQKPMGSGAFIADKYDVFSNISMPYFAEGYINFGFIGLVAFVFFLSVFCARMDYLYWILNDYRYQIKPYYTVLIGSSLFILRGDLLSSVAYTLAVIFDIFIIYRIVRKLSWYYDFFNKLFKPQNWRGASGRSINLQSTEEL